jgi:hypothetical protein
MMTRDHIDARGFTVILILAFTGVYLVFQGKPTTHSRLMLLGDVLFLKEELTFGLISGLILVCAGIYTAPTIENEKT